MLLQLKKLIAFLELSERSDYNPREFCFSYKDFNGGSTNMREQNDTHEFLNIAFDRVENALRDTPQKYLLQNVLGGKTCSVTICKGCGNVNMSSEQFNFSLEVQNQNNIHDDLNRLVTGETINDYQCNACGGAQSQSVEYIGGDSQVHPQDVPRKNQIQDEDEPMAEEEGKGEEENDSWTGSSIIRVYSGLNESNKP